MMMFFSKWMHPGLKLKRWIFLLVSSILILSFGFSGFMSRAFTGWRFDLVHPDTISRLAVRVQRLRFIDFVPLGLGIWGIYFALRRLTFSLVTVLTPHRGDELASVVLRRARLNRGPKVVAIGGGTGLPHLLSGLKRFTGNLTAVVTVADDGGSSGRLRKDLKILPPGDLRNCLVALAETEPLMSRLFQHRFESAGETQGGDLSGHSFGNLFIAAMTEVTGDFGEAIRASSKVLAISGTVLPVTLDSISLKADLADGRTVHGESNITHAKGKVLRLRLEPEGATPNPEVLEAIAKADAIVLGPGSLYTSILPNLLVPGVSEAVAKARAIKIYVCNIMTQPGETQGFRVSDHLGTLRRQTGMDLVDYVVANTESPHSTVLARYHAEGQEMVELDREQVAVMGARVIRARLLNHGGDYARHDPVRLARAVMRLIII